MSGAVKCDTSPNENFEYGYPHSNAHLQFRHKLERCKPNNAACHPTKCDVINDIKLFPTVYGRIYCRKFLPLSNRKSRYKSKCAGPRSAVETCLVTGASLTADPGVVS